MNWHTELERKVIKKKGGVSLVKYGYDGKLGGKPVEVRAIRKDDRFRIQKNTHQQLVRSGGKYIFVNSNGRSKILAAKAVSKKLGRGKWFRDRNYPHKFLKKDDIF